MLNEPKIIWEKWTDPYNLNTDNNSDWSDDDADTYDSIKLEKTNVLLTTMGMIPFNEHTDCCKIFNFWIGHTNFPITIRISDIVQKIDGVETLDIFTRYRFRIAIGKAFDDSQIMRNINKKIYSELNNV